MNKDAERVKAALRDYGEQLAVRCPACGAQPGQRCRMLNAAGTQLDRPHVTRRPQPKP